MLYKLFHLVLDQIICRWITAHYTSPLVSIHSRNVFHCLLQLYVPFPFATPLFYPQVAHSLTLSLPLSSPQIVTARIVTSQLPCFVGRLSKKSRLLLLSDNLVFTITCVSIFYCALNCICKVSIESTSTLLNLPQHIINVAKHLR